MTDPSTPSAEDLSGSIVVVGGGGPACAILDVLDGINRWEVLIFNINRPDDLFLGNIKL